MRRLLLIATVLFIATHALVQTELWRIPGNYLQGVRDKTGNLYLTTQAGDSLLKVTPQGTILWTKHLPAQIFPPVFSGNGFYLSTFSTPDTVSYVDTAGNQLWQFVIQGSHWRPAVDGNGNMYVITWMWDPVLLTIRQQLLKLKPDGTAAYLIDVPRPTLKNSNRNFGVNGPVLDPAGNIWLIEFLTVNKSTSTTSGYSDMMDVYSYFVKLNSADGNTILMKKMFKETAYSAKGSATSDLSATIESWSSTAIDWVLANGKLFGACQYQQTYELNNAKGSVFKNLSEWRVLTIKSNGSSKLLKYRGGCYVDSSDRNNYYADDGFGNFIESFTLGENYSPYLFGQILTGRTVNGVGAMTNDGLIMKAAVGKTDKFLWGVRFTNSGCTPAGYFDSTRGMLLVGCWGDTIRVMNPLGALNTSYYTIHDLSRIMGSLNQEPGMLYANVNDPLPNFVKYSLPSLGGFAATAAREVVENPASYSLAQNYPNPFNPTTTIRFELAQPSAVTLTAYDMLGREVAILASKETMSEGEQEIEFDGGLLATGVYFYRIEATAVVPDVDGTFQHFSHVRKMVLMK